MYSSQKETIPLPTITSDNTESTSTKAKKVVRVLVVAAVAVHRLIKNRLKPLQKLKQNRNSIKKRKLTLNISFHVSMITSISIRKISRSKIN